MDSRTIYKYELMVGDTVTVDMPKGAEVIKVANIGGASTIFMWAIVDPSEKREQRIFHVRGTGHPLGKVGRYVGTVFQGPFVWHVFEAAL